MNLIGLGYIHTIWNILTIIYRTVPRGGSALQTFVHADYVFGFASKQDLYLWFLPVNLGYLYANGFGIWAYDVPEDCVVKGTRQVCFRIDDAIWSKHLDIKELRKMK